MQLRRLRLFFFRNYPELSLETGAGVNCFVGHNGAGKTNLLEAIQYLALTKGFATDRDALQHGARYLSVEGGWESAGAALPFRRLSLSYAPEKGKKLIYDTTPQPRLSDHIGELPLVRLLPSDTDLIRGGGTERRKWLNGLISQFDRPYLEAIVRYEKALRQRNALLKQFAETGRPDPEALAPWDEQLAQAAPLILGRRHRFMEDFLPVFEQYYHDIAGFEQPGIQLAVSLAGESAAAFREALAARHRADIAAGRTTAGPHRDDLILRLDGHPVRQFGSQGQQKSYVTALKFAQYFFLAGHSGRPPLFLLDDVYDKLDAGRMRRITRLLMTEVTGQVFITDTSLDRLRTAFAGDQARPLHFYRVSQGSVEALGDASD